MERAIQRWDFEHAKILSERMNLLERMERRIPWRKEEELLSYRRANVLPNLARALGMDKIPAVIEGYDVSNLGGAFATGSRVVFKGGVPFKQGYRKFRIRTVEGMDDYRMMRELLRRRFSNPRHGEHPDLILIDGGLGHLHEALSELNDMKISIPVIALAKEHERVFVANRKGVADIQPNSPELLLLMHVRDEAHRFARGYHMKLRSKISHLSAFSHMPGIGPVRRKILVDIFADTQLKGFPEGKLRAAKIPVPIIEKLKESFENKHM
jgi:excinuclease ABC subunit C